MKDIVDSASFTRKDFKGHAIREVAGLKVMRLMGVFA